MDNFFLKLEKGVGGLSYLFSTLGSLFLVVMMLVLVAEVCLRAMGTGLLGSYEIVQLSMVPLVFLSLANVQAQKKNVSMSLLYDLFPEKIQPVFDFLNYLCMLTLTVFMVSAAGVQAYYEYSIQNFSAVLYLPKYIFMCLELFGFVVLIIVLIVDLILWGANMVKKIV